MVKPKPVKEKITERQKIVLDTVRMRLRETEAIMYLQAHGYQISIRTLERDKQALEDQKLKRLFLIAQSGFEDQHLERIDVLEMGQRELFLNYLRETDTFKRSIIMEKIIAMQPYISSFYEATKDMMEQNETFRRKMSSFMSRHEDELSADYGLSRKNDTNKAIKIGQDGRLQYINNISQSEKESSNISESRRQNEDSREGTETEDAADSTEVYRREKSKAVF